MFSSSIERFAYERKKIRRKQKRQQDEGERKQQKDMYATSGKTVNRTEHWWEQSFELSKLYGAILVSRQNKTKTSFVRQMANYSNQTKAYAQQATSKQTYRLRSSIFLSSICWLVFSYNTIDKMWSSCESNSVDTRCTWTKRSNWMKEVSFCSSS